MTGFTGKGEIAARYRRCVVLNGDADRDVALDIEAERAVGRDDVEPHRPGVVRGIGAHGKFVLREAAEVLAEAGVLPPDGDGDAGEPVAWHLVVEAGGQRDRCSGIVGEAAIVLDLQPRNVAAQPGVETGAALLALRDRNLILNDADERCARLDRRFSQHRDHARRDDEAVFVVRQNFLSGRREMNVVGEQMRLHRVGRDQR